MSTQQKYIDIKEQRGQYWLENIMKDKFAVSMFGQKRLSREGGIEIVVKELCTRMARDGCQVTCYNRSGHHLRGKDWRQFHLHSLQRCAVLLENMMWYISMQKVQLFFHGFQRCLERGLWLPFMV